MKYSSNTVLVGITCSIRSSFGLTEALCQKNSPYVSPELLYLYLSKSIRNVPGSFWNVCYCLKSFVDYVEVAVNVLNKMGIQKEEIFFHGDT